MINDGTAATGGMFKTVIFVADLSTQTCLTSRPTNDITWQDAVVDSIVSLSAGNHMLTISPDYVGATAESNEGGNSLRKTITV